MIYFALHTTNVIIRLLHFYYLRFVRNWTWKKFQIIHSEKQTLKSKQIPTESAVSLGLKGFLVSYTLLTVHHVMTLGKWPTWLTNSFLCLYSCTVHYVHSLITTQPTNALIVCHLFLNNFFKTLFIAPTCFDSISLIIIREHI